MRRELRKNLKSSDNPRDRYYEAARILAEHAGYDKAKFAALIGAEATALDTSVENVEVSDAVRNRGEKMKTEVYWSSDFRSPACVPESL